MSVAQWDKDHRGTVGIGVQGPQWVQGPQGYSGHRDHCGHRGTGTTVVQYPQTSFYVYSSSLWFP